MSDQEFVDALQAEVKRLTDLNRQQQQDILMLHRQLEDMQKKQSVLNDIRGPEKIAAAHQRRRPNY